MGHTKLDGQSLLIPAICTKSCWESSPHPHALSAEFHQISQKPVSWATYCLDGDLNVSVEKENQKKEGRNPSL